jgi:SecA DEAD-like domain
MQSLRRRQQQRHAAFATIFLVVVSLMNTARSFTILSSPSRILPRSNYKTAGDGHLPYTSTQLSMGVFEDFLTGQDKTVREKENKKYLEELQARVDRINALESSIEELDDEELKAKTQEFRQRIAKGEDFNGALMEEAFAVVREAAW